MSLGTSARARFSAIREVNVRTPRKFDPPRDEQGRRIRVSDFFGSATFDLPKMRDKLPKEIFQKLLSTIEEGDKLDRATADGVAHAIKEWALARGVTHFCHWFQPQTGSTAEKHDAFISFDDHGKAIEKFSGAQLIQSEPDASSFPSGGMRTTFEARGYTAWDPSSPVFVMEHTNGKTLCIPSVFISYHGDALDEKTGLLRSTDAIAKSAERLLKLLGGDGRHKVQVSLGVEQEYFLIDRAFASLRPDLVMTGRTLLGGQPPRGQQLEDHYFGSIPARVQAFMSEMEFELYKLGVPVKTRHNEVAPSQFETAPIFEEANLAADHNQLTMETLRKVALRHQFAVLLHEKPFAGVNGSGKHCNWSLAADGENMLEPGKTPRENLRFLLVLVSVLKGVDRYAGMLRAGIASSGNDHRLGANEAPPAILSVFLGEMLTRILDEIEHGQTASGSAENTMIRLGVAKLPEVMKDNTDRNRTSPFAFTGNKFEFRAVGASASVAFPVTLLNAAVAEGLGLVSTILEEKLKSGLARDAAVLETLKQVATDTRRIRFEGNGYGEEWVVEAEKRKLPHLKRTPEALEQLSAAETVDVLTRQGVFSEAEVHSRHHVRLERYIKSLAIEGDTLRSMVDTQVIPAGLAYFAELSEGAAAAQKCGVDGVGVPQARILRALGDCLARLEKERAALDQGLLKADKSASEEKKAQVFATVVAPAMSVVRTTCDELESLVADDYWPLPKYREMLFLS